MPETLLIRYGAMGEIARFASELETTPGSVVVVRSGRGEELGTIVGNAQPGESHDGGGPDVLRIATNEDLDVAARSRTGCETEFAPWQDRIREWNVNLELIDLERTFDGKLILYVLNDRGPETTKLALRAAAAGFGVIEVQPVGPEGLIQATGGGGGCGNCNHRK
ncbi:MAG: hypothetical protein WBC44_02220 [Planctomycetaceae bacterium]